MKKADTLNIKVINARSAKQLAILAKISHATFHQHNIPALLENALGIMDTEMGMSRGILTLRVPDTDILVIEASKGLSAEEKKTRQVQARRRHYRSCGADKKTSPY